MRTRPLPKPLPPQRQRHAVEIEVEDQPGLRAGHLHHRALLVGEDDRLRPAHDGRAGRACAIDTLDIARMEDVADGAAQIGLRAAEGEAVTQAADRDRILAAAKRQRAGADGAADHPAGLDERQADGADIGGGRARGRCECGERDDEALETRRCLEGHGGSFLFFFARDCCPSHSTRVGVRNRAARGRGRARTFDPDQGGAGPAVARWPQQSEGEHRRVSRRYRQTSLQRRDRGGGHGGPRRGRAVPHAARPRRRQISGEPLRAGCAVRAALRRRQLRSRHRPRLHAAVREIVILRCERQHET